MTKTLALFALAAAAALPAQSATNVGVWIGINAPGQYGRIDVNNYPQPVLVNEQPIIYRSTPVAVYQRPVYLYVPQTHQAHWGRHCGAYRACGQPVYFVRESWVRNEYRREHDRRDGRRGRDGRDGRGDRHDNGQHHGRGPRGD
jgi:hypothetical protein